MRLKVFKKVIAAFCAATMMATATGSSVGAMKLHKTLRSQIKALKYLEDVNIDLRNLRRKVIELKANVKSYIKNLSAYGNIEELSRYVRIKNGTKEQLEEKLMNRLILKLEFMEEKIKEIDTYDRIKDLAVLEAIGKELKETFNIDGFLDMDLLGNDGKVKSYEEVINCFRKVNKKLEGIFENYELCKGLEVFEGFDDDGNLIDNNPVKTKEIIKIEKNNNNNNNQNINNNSKKEYENSIDKKIKNVLAKLNELKSSEGINSVDLFNGDLNIKKENLTISSIRFDEYFDNELKEYNKEENDNNNNNNNSSINNNNNNSSINNNNNNSSINNNNNSTNNNIINTNINQNINNSSKNENKIYEENGKNFVKTSKMIEIENKIKNEVLARWKYTQLKTDIGEVLSNIAVFKIYLESSIEGADDSELENLENGKGKIENVISKLDYFKNLENINNMDLVENLANIIKEDLSSIKFDKDYIFDQLKNFRNGNFGIYEQASQDLDYIYNQINNNNTTNTNNANNNNNNSTNNNNNSINNNNNNNIITNNINRNGKNNSKNEQLEKRRTDLEKRLQKIKDDFSGWLKQNNLSIFDDGVKDINRELYNKKWSNIYVKKNCTNENLDIAEKALRDLEILYPTLKESVEDNIKQYEKSNADGRKLKLKVCKLFDKFKYDKLCEYLKNELGGYTITPEQFYDFNRIMIEEIIKRGIEERTCIYSQEAGKRTYFYDDEFEIKKVEELKEDGKEIKSVEWFVDGKKYL